MTLVIILNVVLCTAALVGVVAPLVWAIVTQHHHETVVATSRGTRQVSASAVDRRRTTDRRRRRGLTEPIVWPVR